MTCAESHDYKHLDPDSDHQLTTYNLQLTTQHPQPTTQHPFALSNDAWYNLR